MEQRYSGLKGKRILLGVSGGIAVFKSVALCSQLVKLGADVRVILTESASKFVTPLTFQTISRHAVAIDTFEEDDPEVVSHIELADWAEIVVIAPATANVIGKLACGIADDMLTTTLLATQAPVMIAPAMNVHMLQHPAVQENLAVLQRRGVAILEPNTGQLACGYVGKGRLPEPEQIIDAIVCKVARERILEGKRVLVTAGGTIERIDPVRYLSNDSSGKMGFAIAEAAAALGAEVHLVAANACLPIPLGVTCIPVQSAADMYEAVMAHFKETDLVIMAAAVADYRPIQQAAEKIKKNEEQMVLKLERTQDILAALGNQKQHQYIVGFAAETRDLTHYAMDKLKRKRCDLLVGNDVSKSGIGFGSDENEVSIFDQQGLIAKWPQASKSMIAHQLLELVAERMKTRDAE